MPAATAFACYNFFSCTSSYTVGFNAIYKTETINSINYTNIRPLPSLRRRERVRTMQNILLYRKTNVVKMSAKMILIPFVCLQTLSYAKMHSYTHGMRYETFRFNNFTFIKIIFIIKKSTHAKKQITNGSNPFLFIPTSRKNPFDPFFVLFLMKI